MNKKQPGKVKKVTAKLVVAADEASRPTAKQLEQAVKSLKDATTGKKAGFKGKVKGQDKRGKYSLGCSIKIHPTNPSKTKLMYNPLTSPAFKQTGATGAMAICRPTAVGPDATMEAPAAAPMAAAMSGAIVISAGAFTACGIDASGTARSWVMGYSHLVS